MKSNKSIKFWIFISIYISTSAVVQPSPLRVHPENPGYFTNGDGDIIYLTGSHTWSNAHLGSFNEFSKMLHELS